MRIVFIDGSTIETNYINISGGVLYCGAYSIYDITTIDHIETL